MPIRDVAQKVYENKKKKSSQWTEKLSGQKNCSQKLDMSVTFWQYAPQQLNFQGGVNLANELFTCTVCRAFIRRSKGSSESIGADAWRDWFLEKRSKAKGAGRRHPRINS